MTATVFPAGLYRTAVRPNLFAVRAKLDPAWMAGAYIAVLLIIPSPLVIGPLGAAGGPANMVALACLAWWAVARFLPGGMAWGFNPVRWAVVAFVMAMFAGFAAGALRPLTGIEVSGADRTVMAMLGFAGVAMLTADGIPSLEQLNTAVKRLVNVAALFATAGILQFYTAIDVAKFVRIPGLSLAIPPTAEFALEERAGLRRVVATASHPIEFGVVLAMILPIALHLALTAAEDEKRFRWLCLGVIGFAVPLSLARSAILGVVCGTLMMWCGWSWPRKKKALKSVLFYLVIMKFLVDGLLGTIRGMFVNMFNDPSYTGRTMDYVKVGEMFGQKPWFGHGLGTFDPRIYFYLDNQYLGTLIETGLIGLVAMSVMFLIGLFTARSVYRMARLAGLTKLGELGRALAASMFVVITSFITFDALAFRMVAGLLFVLLGLIGAAWRIARIESTRLTWRPRPVDDDLAIRMTRLTPA
ncbi:MAG TPA: O-antigen ligase family protein [Acidimicrobiales bacterium]|nr:O-antigen ligase family protein [Acidimicrobiales bacterium]